MRHSIDMGILGVLPDFLRVVVVAQEIDNRRNLSTSRNLLSRAVGAAETALGTPSGAGRNHLDTWRRAYAALGLEPPAPGNSIPSLLKLGQPATPLANLAQALALQHLTPAGADDLAAVTGNLWLRPARATELFVPPTAPERPTSPEIGEIIYVDDGPHVLRRHWHGETGATARITPDTRVAAIYFDCLPPLGISQAEEIADQAARLVGGFLDGVTAIYTLTWHQPAVDIDLA